MNRMQEMGIYKQTKKFIRRNEEEKRKRYKEVNIIMNTVSNAKLEKKKEISNVEVKQIKKQNKEFERKSKAKELKINMFSFSLQQ